MFGISNLEKNLGMGRYKEMGIFIKVDRKKKNNHGMSCKNIITKKGSEMT